MKIEGKHKIDVKRFYLPYSFMSKCPNCGSEREVDLSSDYLSFPVLNEKEPYRVYCENCNHEYNEYLVLEMTITRIGENK